MLKITFTLDENTTDWVIPEGVESALVQFITRYPNRPDGTEMKNAVDLIVTHLDTALFQNVVGQFPSPDVATKQLKAKQAADALEAALKAASGQKPTFDEVPDEAAQKS